MKWLKSWQFLVAVFAVLFVGSAVVITMAVIKHKEPGFIEGVPIWNRASFPLRVAVYKYTSTGVVRVYAGEPLSTAESIVDRVNSRLDFTAFILATGDIVGDIEITVEVPHVVGGIMTGQDPQGNLFHTGEYTRIRHVAGVAEVCEVRVSNVGTAELLGKAIHHGLGHCLGLADGDGPPSIMQNELGPTPDGRIPEWISDYDRKLIIERYR